MDIGWKQASGRPSTREGGRDQGRWGIWPCDGAAAQDQTKACLLAAGLPLSPHAQYVRPLGIVSTCLVCPSDGVAQTKHGLNDQTDCCIYQLTFLPDYHSVFCLVLQCHCLGSCGFALRAEVVSHQSVTRLPAQAGQVRPARARPSHHIYYSASPSFHE